MCDTHPMTHDVVQVQAALREHVREAVEQLRQEVAAVKPEDRARDLRFIHEVQRVLDGIFPIEGANAGEYQLQLQGHEGSWLPFGHADLQQRHLRSMLEQRREARIQNLHELAIQVRRPSQELTPSIVSADEQAEQGEVRALLERLVGSELQRAIDTEVVGDAGEAELLDWFAADCAQGIEVLCGAMDQLAPRVGIPVDPANLASARDIAATQLAAAPSATDRASSTATDLQRTTDPSSATDVRDVAAAMDGLEGADLDDDGAPLAARGGVEGLLRKVMGQGARSRRRSSGAAVAAPSDPQGAVVVDVAARPDAPVPTAARRGASRRGSAGQTPTFGA